MFAWLHRRNTLKRLLRLLDDAHINTHIYKRDGMCGVTYISTPTASHAAEIGFLLQQLQQNRMMK